MTQTTEASVKPDYVDLKWACWSTNESTWEEYAPGIWKRMEAAFMGQAKAIIVFSHPKKEIRYGAVTISKGQATGYFVTEWDDIEDLAEALGTPCDEAFRETIPLQLNLEPGHERHFVIKARKFQRLIERIDNEEAALLEHDRKAWANLEKMFKKTK
jgi:hypothetical protein